MSVGFDGLWYHICSGSEFYCEVYVSCRFGAIGCASFLPSSNHICSYAVSDLCLAKKVPPAPNNVGGGSFKTMFSNLVGPSDPKFEAQFSFFWFAFIACNGVWFYL